MLAWTDGARLYDGEIVKDMGESLCPFITCISVLFSITSTSMLCHSDLTGTASRHNLLQQQSTQILLLSKNFREHSAYSESVSPLVNAGKVSAAELTD